MPLSRHLRAEESVSLLLVRSEDAQIQLDELDLMLESARGNLKGSSPEGKTDLDGVQRRRVQLLKQRNEALRCLDDALEEADDEGARSDEGRKRSKPSHASPKGSTPRKRMRASQAGEAGAAQIKEGSILPFLETDGAGGIQVVVPRNTSVFLCPLASCARIYSYRSGLWGHCKSVHKDWRFGDRGKRRSEQGETRPQEVNETKLAQVSSHDALDTAAAAASNTPSTGGECPAVAVPPPQ